MNNGLNAHEYRGNHVAQCPRCLKGITGEGVHTCTPTNGWRDMEKRIAELDAENKELVEALEHYEIGGSNYSKIARAALAKVRKE